MPTDLLSRLSAGRFWGDNAEVLKALGWRAPVPKVALGESLTVALSLDAPPLPLDDMNAALRLVPEGWRTYRAGNMHGPWFWVLDRSPGQFYTVEGEGPTAAVALTIAILRAKEAENA